MIVLDKITNIGGDERMAGTANQTSRMEILGQDGETDDGKPYRSRGSGRICYTENPKPAVTT